MAIVKLLNKSFEGEGIESLPHLVIVDEIESAGSLFLFDVSKIGNNDINITEKGINTEIKNANAFDLHDTRVISKLNYSADNKIKVERTKKGGIHTIINPNLNIGELTENDYYNISLEGDLKDYLVGKGSNTTNLYVSAWTKYTSYTDEAYGEDLSNFSSNSNNNQERVWKISFTTLKNNQKPTLLLGDVSHTSTYTPPNAATPANIFNGGCCGLNKAGANNKKFVSKILYRFYIEDLDLSGRTRQEVEALDRELFTKAFSNGGKFYDDMWTNPQEAFK